MPDSRGVIRIVGLCLMAVMLYFLAGKWGLGLGLGLLMAFV